MNCLVQGLVLALGRDAFVKSINCLRAAIKRPYFHIVKNIFNFKKILTKE